MPSHHGKSGKSAGVSQGYQSVHDTGAVSQTPGRTTAPVTSTGNGKKTTTGDGLHVAKKAATVYSAIKHPLISAAKYIGQKVFQPKTEQQKVQANIDKGYDVHNPAEMHAAKKTYKDFSPAEDGANVNLARGANTQSLVTAPTADKAAGFGHQWNFQAYPGANTNVAANPYDYTKAPYAKKGKLVRKYATGQEIINFSKGKRFGPPPLKGPDPHGLQVILENSDYFKKLIG